jgi:hypothetical protein
MYSIYLYFWGNLLDDFVNFVLHFFYWICKYCRNYQQRLFTSLILSWCVSVIERIALNTQYMDEWRSMKVVCSVWMFLLISSSLIFISLLDIFWLTNPIAPSLTCTIQNNLPFEKSITKTASNVQMWSLIFFFIYYSSVSFYLSC